MVSARTKSLESFLNPKSIAVVGASRDPKKIGNICIRNIQESGFEGSLFPVNPSASQINSLECYPDLKALPVIPDLVLISLPVDKVLAAFQEVADLQIKNAIIFTAGFKEVGHDGVVLEQKLLEVAEYHNINLLGPNCLGFLNSHAKLNATFGQGVKHTGNLRFLSQSGAIAASMFDYANFAGFGFDQFVTLGNKAGLNENDFLEYWLNDTKSYAPLGLYLESVSNGHALLEKLTEYGRRSPVFILKPGKSSYAQKAMKSHTGSLAGEDIVLSAVLNQAGVIRCMDIEDLFDYAKAFSWAKAPTGPNVAVVSNAGGPAVIAADLLADAGLNVYPFDLSTQEILREHLPRAASIMNPVDLLGDALPQRYEAALSAVLAESAVDAVLVILTPQVMTQAKETAQVIANLAEQYHKTIFCSFIGGTNVFSGEEMLNAHKVPNFRYPGRAIKMLSELWKWEEHRLKSNSGAVISLVSGFDRDQKKYAEDIRQHLHTKNSDQPIPQAELLDLLKSVGIQIPEYILTTDVNDAISFADKIRYPVVMKLDSLAHTHKTEVGGVIMGVTNKQEVSAAFENFSKRSDFGQVLVQKQIEAGTELILGAKLDRDFGQMLMFGAGGIFVELIQDVNLHTTPLDFDEVQRLVERSKIHKLLNGHRGRAGYDLNKLYETILKFSNLVSSTKTFKEIEINPLIVNSSGVFAVDIRAICK